jgi:hypothetical protein
MLDREHGIKKTGDFSFCLSFLFIGDEVRRNGCAKRV